MRHHTTFARTFHPVGQGAFYSEDFEIYNYMSIPTVYRVVYDCGSKKDKNWLKTRVTSAFPDNDIDLLFLSHFHDDHYKGVEFLNPKIIVLPLLDEWDKVIFWVGKNLKKNSIDIEYPAELRNRFPKSRFIYISPSSGETRSSEETINIENIENGPSGYLLDSGNDTILPSGSLLTGNTITDWIYIPVNPKLDKSMTDRFRHLLSENKIDEDELKKLDVKFFQSHRKVLSKIYKKIGDPNEFSMAVYSGPNPYLPHNPARLIDMDDIRIKYIFSRNNQFGAPVRWWWDEYWDDVKVGCLYLGDMNLSDKDKKRSELLRNIYRLLPQKSIYTIGTIQIPHHGSIDNFHPLIKSYYDWTTDQWKQWERPKIYLISVGESNTYGHPSAWVLKELMDNGNCVILVTEKSTSCFIEKAQFEIEENDSKRRKG